MKPKAKQFILKGSIAFVALSLLLPVTVFGAEKLETIVVTAQKRIQSLQTVPVSVEVVSGKQILNMNITDFGDLSRNLPAINISKGGASDQLYIRGIGSGFNPGFEQSVGTYIDGVYMGRSRATRAALLDIKQVEILKGPQTTFFGNSSIAGAFNVTTASPEVGGGFSGYVSGMTSFDYGETNFTGAINIPVGNTLAVRIAGRKYNFHGYEKDTFTHTTVGGTDDTFGRITAVWKPTTNFKAVAKYTYGYSFETSPFVKEVFDCNNQGAGNPAGRPGTSCNVNAGQLDNQLNYQVQNSSNDWTKMRFSQGNLRMDWDVGPFTVTSLTAEVNDRNQDLMDLDSGPYLNFNTDQHDNTDQFSQELRLTSPTGGFLEWMTGAYYQDQRVNFDGSQLPYFIGAPPLQMAITAAQAMGKQLGGVHILNQNSKTYSAFGAATFNVLKAAHISFGLRWIRVDKSINQNMFWALFTDATASLRGREPTTPPFPGFITPGTGNGRGHWSSVLPSVNLQYDLTPTSMVYAKYSKGFKAGGFDFSSKVGDSVPSFKPEHVDSYEIGLKSKLFDDRMRLNLDAFYADYRDLQQSVLNTTDFTFSVANAARSTTRGIELDWDYSATDNLLLSLNATVMDAHYNKFLGACSTYENLNGLCPLGYQDLSGHVTTYAPRYSGLVKATYTVDVRNFHLNFEPQIFFTDGYYLQSDFDPHSYQKSFVRFNMRVSLHSENNTWEIALIGKNLNNVKTMFFENGLPGSPGAYMAGLNRPRSVAIQARYNF